MLFRRRRAVTCRQVVELLTDYLEGALGTRERDRLETHLAGCPHCDEYLTEMKAIIAASGRVEPEDLTDEALDDLVALYRSWRSG